MEKARMLGTEQAVVGGTEGGRSPTGVPPTTAANVGPGACGPEAAVAAGAKPIPDPAVPERPVRRRFAAEYKLRILREADACTEPGGRFVLPPQSVELLRHGCVQRRAMRVPAERAVVCGFRV